MCWRPRMRVCWRQALSGTHSISEQQLFSHVQFTIRLLLYAVPKQLTYIAELLAQVLASAHAVVLASGTLAPLASLEQQLFPHVPPERMRRFSCGHVVRHLFLHHSCMHATFHSRPDMPESRHRPAD